MTEAGAVPYIPISTNFMSIPKDEKLKASYYAYKVSEETQQLESEQGRSIFAEAFFDDEMQVLSNLCVKVLAKSFGVAKLPPIIQDNPLALRIFYDALSIDLPLAKVYCITDVPFWKRIVLKQMKNSVLRFRDDVNWKNMGISQKFVQELETKSAEYYPELELFELAKKIKSFVTEMHIEHLQSLKETTFAKNFEVKDSDEDSSEDEVVDDYDWDYLIISSDEEVADEESDISDLKSLRSFIGFENSFYKIQEPVANIKESASVMERLFGSKISISNIPKTKSIYIEHVDSAIKLDIKAVDDEIKQFVKHNRALIRTARKEKEDDKKSHTESKIAKSIEAEEKLAAEAKRIARLRKLELKKKKRNSSLLLPPSLFEIKLPNNEERLNTGFELIEDSRNPELLAEKRKRYKYPAQHCHHLDLSFLQWFTNLETLIIEFQGPQVTREYHTRHFNVSYQDMRNLANGIKTLPKLKTFRLRNSRLDTRKFFTVINVLRKSNTVEVVDFGNDFLDDHCALPIYLYLKHTKCLKSLELEGNKFGNEFLKKLAYGLFQYKSGQLEYLGLARNKIFHPGFHFLIKILNETNHVKSLNLTATCMEDAIISCCIAKNLIKKHEQLEQLNLLAVPIDYQTSVNLESALRLNQTILELNIRGCGMPTEIEYEIEVLLQRNRFLKENPHIGNMDLTEKEANDILKNKRNPIYARVLAKFNKQLECLDQRKSEYVTEDTKSQNLDIIEIESVLSDDISERSSDLDTFRSNSRKYYEPFVYDPNTFAESDIMRHLKIQGPADRYQYFQHERLRKSYPMIKDF